MRFQTDEHLANAITTESRKLGIDIVTASEAGVRGEPDAAVLARAHAEQRVVVTFDDDYIRLHYAGQPHSGIIFCSPPSQSIGQVIDWIRTVDGASDPEEMTGHLLYV